MYLPVSWTLSFSVTAMEPSDTVTYRSMAELVSNFRSRAVVIAPVAETKLWMHKLIRIV